MPKQDPKTGRFVSCPEKPLAERFWEKVDKHGPDDCWEWTAAKTKGYGIIGVGKKLVYAHRVSWELANGSIPKGMCICHHCDVRMCVNPNHMFLGLQAENLADAAKKGRLPRGEKSWGAKLTETKVHKIRGLLARGLSQKVIGRQYSMSQTTICNINTGKSWAWLKE